MNKNLKRTIAVALSLSALSAVTQMSNMNLLSTKAYAASSSYRLTDIDLEDSSGNDITLYEDSDYDDELDDDSTLRTTYYAKVSSSKSKVKVNTYGGDGTVRIFKGTSSTAYEEGDSISISSGKTTLYINVYDDDTNEDDMSRTKNYERQYKVIVQRGSDDDDDDDENDDVFLDNISLSDGDISFSKRTNSYNIKVSSSVDEITVKAEPANEDDYTVRINGSKVYEDDNWKKTIDLDKGKNTITITVEDDDDNKRTYTLYVTRGTSSTTSDKIYLDTLKVGSTELKLTEDVKDYNLSVKSSVEKIAIFADPKDVDYTVTIDGSTVKSSDDYKKTVELEEDKVNTFKVKVKNTSGTEQVYTINIGRGDVPASKYPVINGSNANNNSNVNNNVSANRNKWVQTGGLWQYYDGMGNAVKDTWVGNYYLDSNSYMLANTWKYISNAWYYFNASGAKHTGWLLNGGQWYYLNSDGRMVTGWFKDFDGQWYYLQDNGAMAKNTTIDGYKLGSNGAWITR